MAIVVDGAAHVLQQQLSALKKAVACALGALAPPVECLGRRRGWRILTQPRTLACGACSVDTDSGLTGSASDLRRRCHVSHCLSGFLIGQGPLLEAAVPIRRWAWPLRAADGTGLKRWWAVHPL